MESGGTSKRTADSDQTVDTYAFCQNCMRVSTSLQNCDKCGTQLTSENHIGSYGAEPKRARTEKEGDESTATSGGTATAANGAPAVNGSGRGSTTMNGSASSSPAPNNPAPSSGPVPVPQALYVNKNIISTSENTTAPVVRPQAIYMNVNNQVSSSSATASPRSTSNTVSTQSTSLTSSTNTSSSGPTLRSAASSHNNTDSRSPANPPSAATNSIDRSRPPTLTNSTNSTANYNSAASQRAMSGNFPPNAVAPANQPPSTSSVTVLPNMVSIPAQQIRIGAQKFKPLTSVQFKDDGILFTLKDYTYAPVLLNARAILKCKANLNLFQYPLFLLYLEGSCMKQIRNIFGLRDDEFSADNPCEMKRCITILPAITRESATEMITRKQSVDKDLRNMFDMMERRYERYNKILEHITPEEGCDIILSLLGSRTPAPTQSRASAVPTASAPSAAPNRARPASSQLAGYNAAAAATAAMQARRMPNAQPHAGRGGNMPPIAPGSMEGGPVMHNPTSGGQQVAGRTPTLIIPSDPTKWREMQRSLVVGGVYHVQTAGSQGTQYCLWNGTQLVPCRVQNAEVQLDCHQVWIGSLRVKVMTKVRIKADNNAGFHFNILYKSRQHVIFIPYYSIPQCQVCRDSNLATIFLDIAPQFAESLRPKLQMGPFMDPTLNPHAKEERRKRIVLFMKTINNDQWDALVSMQSSGRYTHKEIDIIAALKILADCKSNNRVQQKITDWLAKKTPKPNLVVLENMAKDLAQPEDNASNDNDDDDDVIMTQEEVGIKCPYTQQVMKDPIRNKICGHNYEKAAIHDFILRKKNGAKCPYAGCGNQTPLNLADMESNLQLQDYIRKLK